MKVKRRMIPKKKLKILVMDNGWIYLLAKHSSILWLVYYLIDNFMKNVTIPSIRDWIQSQFTILSKLTKQTENGIEFHIDT